MSFKKSQRRATTLENSDFNQLDFPINNMLFTSSQFKIRDKFNDMEEFKKLKIRFNAILGKYEDEVWSSVKIVKVMTITRDNLFEGLLQNFLYIVVR